MYMCSRGDMIAVECLSIQNYSELIRAFRWFIFVFMY